MDSLISTLNAFQYAFAFVLLYWWIWLPILLFMVYWGSLEAHNRAKFLSELKWILLEIRFPAEAHKSLHAMEQIFVDLHGVAPPPKSLKDKFNAMRDRVFKGKVPPWHSFEIVGDSSEIHFYIRTLQDNRDLVEAQIYGHYPDAEITQVADYTAAWPAELPSEEYDVNGVEFGLVKESIIPIKTYPEFEEKGAGKEDVRRIDPMAPLVQALSMLGFAERVGIQVLIRPTGQDWVKKDQKVIDKLFEKPEKVELNAAGKVFNFIDTTAGSLVGAEPPKKEEKKESKAFNQLNPGVQDLIKAIEHGTSKLSFETGIRILYVARRDGFNKARLGTVQAAFKQFSSAALNGFKPEFSAEVKKGFHKEKKTLENKKKISGSYKKREFPKKPFILNTEELTTIYHFPDVGVKTPALPRVEAKKGEAPAGIPTV